MITIIAAVAKNGVIGSNNSLPWRLSGDLLFFKQVTLGKPVIMGRKTYESIGKPLPNRTNIVVSKSIQTAPDILVVNSLEDAICKAKRMNREVMVIGGAQIYKQAMEYANKLYITEVDAEVDGDAYFPEISEDWIEVDRKRFKRGVKDEYDYDIVTYKRS